jgi:hypothetical protein
MLLGRTTLNYQDIPVKIHEVDVKLRQRQKWARKLEHLHDHQSKDISHHSSHYLYRVSSMRDGRQWFIDITDSQFGMHQTFSEADHYTRKCGSRIRSIAPLGTAKAQQDEIGEAKGYKMAMARIHYRQDYGVVNAVEKAVDDWKIRNCFTSQELLLQGVEKFEELKVWWQNRSIYMLRITTLLLRRRHFLSSGVRMWRWRHGMLSGTSKQSTCSGMKSRAMLWRQAKCYKSSSGIPSELSAVMYLAFSVTKRRTLWVPTPGVRKQTEGRFVPTNENW